MLWGIPGRSNALNIAARLGLESEILDDAHERAGTSGAQVNAVIAELELAERAENEAVTKAAKLRVEASKVKRELAEKQAVLDEFRVRSPAEPQTASMPLTLTFTTAAEWPFGTPRTVCTCQLGKSCQ